MTYTRTIPPNGTPDDQIDTFTLVPAAHVHTLGDFQEIATAVRSLLKYVPYTPTTRRTRSSSVLPLLKLRCSPGSSTNSMSLPPRQLFPNTGLRPSTTASLFFTCRPRNLLQNSKLRASASAGQPTIPGCSRTAASALLSSAARRANSLRCANWWQGLRDNTFPRFGCPELVAF